MAKTKAKNYTQKAKEEHMRLLSKEIESDVMISDKNQQFKMAVGQSLFNVMKLKEIGVGKGASDEEMIERLNEFFKRCAETGQLPTIEKACLSLGMTTAELRKIKEGQIRGFTLKTKDIVKELYTTCGAITGDLAFKGEVNPIVYIFTAKNYFDMTDKQEMVITPSNSIEPTESVDVIEAKYNELPED